MARWNVILLLFIITQSQECRKEKIILRQARRRSRAPRVQQNTFFRHDFCVYISVRVINSIPNDVEVKSFACISYPSYILLQRDGDLFFDRNISACAHWNSEKSEKCPFASHAIVYYYAFCNCYYLLIVINISHITNAHADFIIL